MSPHRVCPPDQLPSPAPPQAQRLLFSLVAALLLFLYRVRLPLTQGLCLFPLVFSIHPPWRANLVLAPTPCAAIPQFARYPRSFAEKNLLFPRRNIGIWLDASGVGSFPGTCSSFGRRIALELCSADAAVAQLLAGPTHCTVLLCNVQSLHAPAPLCHFSSPSRSTMKVADQGATIARLSQSVSRTVRLRNSQPRLTSSAISLGRTASARMPFIFGSQTVPHQIIFDLGRTFRVFFYAHPLGAHT